jgi:hypothetical protein
MKIRCKFKDPDTMQDAVVDAMAKVERPVGVSAMELAQLRGERIREIQSQISDAWMEYGEYLDIEFDTDAKTAKVLTRGSIK